MGTTNAYNETYTYDANGNIKTLERYDGAATPVKIDGLTYGYNLDGNGNLINNRLRHVKDTRSSSLCDYDIDDQNDDNYLYDAIGNLTKDNAEGIDNIEWNAYGKISKITRVTGVQKSALEFIYDAMGNRVCKIEKPYNLTSTGWKYTFYVRDASGNIMTTYTKTGSEIENNVLKLDEVMLYGSGRIGTCEIGVELTSITIPTVKFSRTLGLKRYEIGNHLGNVLITFTDRKKQVQSGNSVTGYETYIASAQDYYPFGMIMNERKWNTSSYKFGFNGKEKDDETYGTGNEYDFGERGYDPRRCQFLSIDKLWRKYAKESNYIFTSNNPILYLDNDGNDKVYYLNIKLKDGTVITLATKRIVNNQFVRHARYYEGAGPDGTGGSPKVEWFYTDVKQTLTFDLSTKKIVNITKEESDYSNKYSVAKYAAMKAKRIFDFTQGDGWTLASPDARSGNDPDNKSKNWSGYLPYDEIMAAIGALGQNSNLPKDLKIAEDAKDLCEKIQKEIDKNKSQNQNNEESSNDNSYDYVKEEEGNPLIGTKSYDFRKLEFKNVKTP